VFAEPITGNPVTVVDTRSKFGKVYVVIKVVSSQTENLNEYSLRHSAFEKSIKDPSQEVQE